MREIKIRAWDTTKDQWQDFTGVAVEDSARPDIYEVISSDGSRVIEQCTGLKDKNGVEIFEGDILRNPKVKYAQVRFVAWSPLDAMFITVGEDPADEWEMYGPDYHDNCEVIGNIHENPELLEAPCQAE